MFYIYNYYFEQSWIINNMRRFMGPVLTVVGLYLYFLTTVKDDSAMGYWGIVFCLAYGLFYSVKPLILVLAMGAKDETFDYKLKKNSIYIKDRVREASIDLQENKLDENKKYFFIKLKNKQIIFFPKSILDEKAYSNFREILE